MLKKSSQRRRVLGKILLRGACLNHVIVPAEARLRRAVTCYFRCDHKHRTQPRPVRDSKLGRVIGFSEVVGLHPHHERRAAA
jgi:hypothetical protein